MATSVALVEDDPDLRTTLRRGLEREGFEVISAATGRELLERVQTLQPSAFVIDIGLPDSDGRDVCQALRTGGVTSPVIFLTARGALNDRLAGFAAGGDDYLVKPFAFKELVVRLHALTRRARAAEALQIAGLLIDPTNQTVAADGSKINLTPTEFRLLAAFAINSGTVLRRRDLMAAAWPGHGHVRGNTFDAAIARLRRKLQTIGRADAITTERGVGYRIE